MTLNFLNRNNGGFISASLQYPELQTNWLFCTSILSLHLSVEKTKQKLKLKSFTQCLYPQQSCLFVEHKKYPLPLRSSLGLFLHTQKNGGLVDKIYICLPGKPVIFLPDSFLFLPSRLISHSDSKKDLLIDSESKLFHVISFQCLFILLSAFPNFRNKV